LRKDNFYLLNLIKMDLFQWPLLTVAPVNYWCMVTWMRRLLKKQLKFFVFVE